MGVGSMDKHFPSWLTKPMLTGVKGFNLDAYVMALEGWRRGLTLKWYYNASDVTDLKMIGFNPLAKTFSLSQKETIHYFYRSRGDKVTNEARSEERRVGREYRASSGKQC